MWYSQKNLDFWNRKQRLVQKRRVQKKKRKLRKHLTSIKEKECNQQKVFKKLYRSLEEGRHEFAYSAALNQ